MYQVFKNFLFNQTSNEPQIIESYSGLVLQDGTGVQAVESIGERTRYTIIFDIGDNAKFDEEKDTYIYTGNRYATTEKERDRDIYLNPGIPKSNNEKLEFKGWTKTEGSTKIDYYNGSYYNENQNITLYAVWGEKTYTVTYYYNSPSAVNINRIVEQDSNIVYGTNYTIYGGKEEPFISNEYKFEYWTTNLDGTGDRYNCGDTKTITSNMTLYAQWNIRQVQFSYNKNVPEEDENKVTDFPENPGQYNVGSEITITDKIPKRDGYEFEGWSIFEGGENTVQYIRNDIIKMPENDLTLYAVWKKNVPHTVTYLANGTEVSNLQEIQVIPYGEECKVSTTIPVRNNYIFLGWSESSNAITGSYKGNDTLGKIERNITLYAIWKHKDSHTVTYAKNTQDTVTDLTLTQTVNYEQDWIVLNQQPKRQLYDFIGWTYHPQLDTVAYKAGDNYGQLEKNVTVYAIWKEYPTLIYHIDGDNGDVEVAERYSRWADVTIKEDATNANGEFVGKKGYTLIGWTDQKGSSVVKYSRNEKVNMQKFISTYNKESIDLYPVWKENIKVLATDQKTKIPLPSTSGVNTNSYNNAEGYNVNGHRKMSITSFSWKSRGIYGANVEYIEKNNLTEMNNSMFKYSFKSSFTTNNKTYSNKGDLSITYSIYQTNANWKWISRGDLEKNNVERTQEDWWGSSSTPWSNNSWSGKKYSHTYQLKAKVSKDVNVNNLIASLDYFYLNSSNECYVEWTYDVNINIVRDANGKIITEETADGMLELTVDCTLTRDNSGCSHADSGAASFKISLWEAVEQ